MEVVASYKYFELDYARLYRIDENKTIEYCIECEEGVIANLFSKRKIDIHLFDGIQYYDLVTPYDYGRSVILGTSDQKELISAYMESFKSYTEREDIIVKFVRFHPIICNCVDFKEAYNTIYDWKAVEMALTYYDAIGTWFSKK